MSTGTTRRRLNKETFLQTIIPFDKQNILKYSEYFEFQQLRLISLKEKQQKIEEEIKTKLDNILLDKIN